MRADDQVDLPGRDLTEERAARRRGHRAGQQRDLESRRRQQPRDRRMMLLGEDFGRRHEGDLPAVLHREERRQQRHDGLARADVALQQPVHRLRLLHVLADVLQRLALAAGEVKREHASQRLTDPIVDVDRETLALGIALLPPQQQADLKAEEFFQDQPTLCRRSKPVENCEGLIGLREVRRDERGAAIRQPQCAAHVGRQGLWQIVGKSRQRVGHQLPLHLRSDRPRAFVDWDDTACVKRFDLVAVDDLELRVGDLQARPLVAFERAVHDHPGARPDLIFQVRRVEPGQPHRAGLVAEQRLEDPHAGTPRASQSGRDDLPGNRDSLAFAERRDRLQAAAVFVAQREAEEEIFDRGKAGAGEVGRFARADALQELQRGLQVVAGGHRRAIARPWPDPSPCEFPGCARVDGTAPRNSRRLSRWAPASSS